MTEKWREELTSDQKQIIYERVIGNVGILNAKSLSNGSLMRVSPIGIAFRNLDEKR